MSFEEILRPVKVVSQVQIRFLSSVERYTNSLCFVWSVSFLMVRRVLQVAHLHKLLLPYLMISVESEPENIVMCT